MAKQIELDARESERLDKQYDEIQATRLQNKK